MLEDFKKTYEARKNTELKIKGLEKEIDNFKSELGNIMNECNHDIAFIIYDYRPRKVGLLTYCICPACGKIEYISMANKIYDTVFRNSRIIDLTDESIEYTKDNLNIIQTCFFETIGNVDEYELEQMIVEKIKENKIKTRSLSILDRLNN